MSNLFSSMIQSINISVDLTNSGCNELGRIKPYTTPKEIDSEITYVSSLSFEIPVETTTDKIIYNEEKWWRKE